MPTYEFRCPAGHTFDRFMKMSEAAAELPCPECGAAAMRQVSGGAGLLFKGSGFYLTDYGRNAHRTSGSGPAGSAGGEGKGDSKGGQSKGGDSKGTSGSGSAGGTSSTSGSSSGSSSSSSGGSGGSGGGSGAGGTK